MCDFIMFLWKIWPLGVTSLFISGSWPILKVWWEVFLDLSLESPAILLFLASKYGYRSGWRVRFVDLRLSLGFCRFVILLFSRVLAIRSDQVWAVSRVGGVHSAGAFFWAR